MIACVLTGKKNSTFKNKNSKKILGKEIFLYPAIEAKKCKKIDAFFVSSDSDLILNKCSKEGYQKIKRPKILCTKNALHRDVLLHFLKFAKKDGIEPEIIVVLLANSPTIKFEWIEKSIKIMMANKNLSAVVPVVKNNDYHPLRAKKVSNNLIKAFVKKKKNISTNRQDLEPSYFLAHNFWTIRSQELILNRGENPWKFMGPKVKPLIINESVDVHEERDLYLCETWLRRNLNYR